LASARASLRPALSAATALVGPKPSRGAGHRSGQPSAGRRGWPYSGGWARSRCPVRLWWLLSWQSAGGRARRLHPWRV